MTAPIVVDNVNYFENFATAQGLGDPTLYYDYALDMDSCYQTLRVSINSLITEVNAVGGVNAVLGLDMFTVDHVGGPFTVTSNGTIGWHSYLCAITDVAEITVQPGQAMASGTRVSRASSTVLPVTGGAGTYYVAVDTNGMPSIETSSDAQVLDLYSFAFNGTIITPTVLTRLAAYHVDGDEYQYQLTVDGTANAFPAKSYRGTSERIYAIERILSGMDSNGDGDTLGPVGMPPGTSALPGWILTDGAGNEETGSGFFRQAANVLGLSISGVERFRWNTQGMLAVQDGSAAAPVWSRSTDVNTGIFFNAGDDMGVSVGGNVAMRWVLDSGVAQALLSGIGTTALPDLSVIGDPNTGIRMPGSDVIELITNAVVAVTLNANQTISSPTQHRCRVTASGFTISETALANIDFDVEVTDIGGMCDVGGGNPDRVTIVTDGWYNILGTVQFDESSAASGGVSNEGDFRHVAISIDGSLAGPTGQHLEDISYNGTPSYTGDIILNVCDQLELSAGAIVRLQAAHDNGGDINVNANLTVAKMW